VVTPSDGIIFFRKISCYSAPKVGFVQPDNNKIVTRVSCSFYSAWWTSLKHNEQRVLSISDGGFAWADLQQEGLRFLNHTFTLRVVKAKNLLMQLRFLPLCVAALIFCFNLSETAVTRWGATSLSVCVTAPTSCSSQPTAFQPERQRRQLPSNAAQLTYVCPKTCTFAWKISKQARLL